VARKRNAKGQFTRNGSAVANRRRRRHRRNGAMTAVANRRRHRRHYRNGAMTAVANRRRRRHHRNYSGTDFKSLLMTGLAIGAGFAAHRAIRHVIDDQALSKINALNTGTAAQYRGMIASAATVLVGVSALQMVKGSVGAQGKQAIAEAQGGMVASVVLDLLSQALRMSKSTEDAAGYLSGFGEYVPMSGFGEYVPVNQGSTMYAQAGMGSYYSLSGLGAISQAAAGVPLSGGLYEAAAGMGKIYEAAAGMGEYFPPGPKQLLTRKLAISGFGDTSLQPKLSAAERALTVAEAVAGLGEDTVEKPIVDAWQVDMPLSTPDDTDSRNYGTLSPFVDDSLQDPEDIDDEAKGLRQGVLAGGSFG